MNTEFSSILTSIRNQFVANGLRDFNIDTIVKETSISESRLQLFVDDDKQLAQKLLEQERNQLKKNIETFFDVEENAIDSLIYVTKEVSANLRNYIPHVARHVIQSYPDIFRLNFYKRIDFITNSIGKNITQGKKEGLYRSDISVELLTRMFISLLMDFYLKDPHQYNGQYFEVLYENVFEKFILRASTEKGLEYYLSKNDSEVK